MNIREVNHMSARHFVPHCRMQLHCIILFEVQARGRGTEADGRISSSPSASRTEAGIGRRLTNIVPRALVQAARSSDSSQDQIHGYEPETVAVKIKDILKVLVLKVSFYWLANQR